MPNLISFIQLNQDQIDEIILMKDFTLQELNFIPIRTNENVYIRIHNDFLFIKIIDITNLEMLAFAILEYSSINGENGYKIILTKSFVRNRSLMSYIFQFILFELDEIIFSDTTHTLPGSMDFWKNLKKLPNVEIHVINIDTGVSSLYDLQLDEDIWGIAEDLMLNGHVDRILLREYLDLDIISYELYSYIIRHAHLIQNKETTILKLKPI